MFDCNTQMLDWLLCGIADELYVLSSAVTATGKSAGMLEVLQSLRKGRGSERGNRLFGYLRCRTPRAEREGDGHRSEKEGNQTKAHVIADHRLVVAAATAHPINRPGLN
jgi:hypothetical protein